MSRLAVIDYNSGNLYSVVKALELTAPAGVEVVLTDDADIVAASDRVVFPGQGSPGACMRNLSERALTEPIRESLASKPFLGICMGMQLMFGRSEEGGVAGLRCVDEPVQSLRPADDTESSLRLPHIGWNRVHLTRPHPVAQGIGEDSWFYFVHSYAWLNTDHPYALGLCTYGQVFCAILAYDNVFCTQFHPEKSSHAGLKLLHNFHRWRP